MRISVVSYINTLPFRYGILNAPTKPEGCIYTISPPAECAQKLIDGTTDAGLIPVASIPQLSEHVIFSDYCIAADHEAFSVLILSRKPLEKVEKILLDYQSRSSVAMLKILNDNYMHLQVAYEDTCQGYENDINDTTAGLVIGDRAMLLRNNYEYVYDLASLWRKHTGLPAVFAVWVANTNVSNHFAAQFDAMMEYGVAHIANALKSEYLGTNTDTYADYFTKHLSYRLTEQKRQSIRLFLKLLTGKDFSPIFLNEISKTKN